jgi:hypothetical protein
MEYFFRMPTMTEEDRAEWETIKQLYETIDDLLYEQNNPLGIDATALQMVLIDTIVGAAMDRPDPEGWLANAAKCHVEALLVGCKMRYEQMKKGDARLH